MSIERRVSRLEEGAFALPAYCSGKWPLEDQLESVADKLRFYMRFHADGRVRYSATDRELHLLDALCEGWGLEEDARRYFERMNPSEQAERERHLFEDRHRAKKDRERLSWHQEHGWERPAPEHLRTW